MVHHRVGTQLDILTMTIFFPKLRRKHAERRFFRSNPRADVFRWIYETNRWGSGESRSGKGSELDTTEVIRDYLPQIIQELGATSLLDVPCGDMNWIQTLDLQVPYIGADIVEPLIERNRIAHPQHQFEVIDVCSDPLPSADLILMRDLLVHFSYADLALALPNIYASNARYLACTTFPELTLNADKLTGKHRRLNMCLAPFNWPEPLSIVDENDGHGKHLGVWEISRLKDLSIEALGREAPGT